MRNRWAQISRGINACVTQGAGHEAGNKDDDGSAPGNHFLDGFTRNRINR